MWDDSTAQASLEGVKQFTLKQEFIHSNLPNSLVCGLYSSAFTHDTAFYSFVWVEIVARSKRRRKSLSITTFPLPPNLRTLSAIGKIACFRLKLWRLISLKRLCTLIMLCVIIVGPRLGGSWLITRESRRWELLEKPSLFVWFRGENVRDAFRMNQEWIP